MSEKSAINGGQKAVRNALKGWRISIKKPKRLNRMTEMQSAIGLTELERIDHWNMPTRLKNAHIIIGKIKGITPIEYQDRVNVGMARSIQTDYE